MLFHKSPLQGCCLWFMWAEMARLSCVAVYLDHSARCIISSQGPLAIILNHGPGSSISAHGPQNWGVSAVISPQGVWTEGSGMRGLCRRWPVRKWMLTQHKGEKKGKRRKKEEGRKKEKRFFILWPRFYFLLFSCSVMSNSFVTVAHHAYLSLRFSRQEYWSGLPFPSPGYLPNQGSNPHLLCLLNIGGSFTTEPPGKPYYTCVECINKWNIENYT